MPQVLFSPAARAEMFDALAWYDARVEGLGDRFIAEVDAALDRIVTNERQFPVVLADIRRARLRRFPYALFFRVVEDTVQVIGCFHGSRDPRRWRRRA
jgi:toxin ParE1/3/4